MCAWIKNKNPLFHLFGHDEVFIKNIPEKVTGFFNYDLSLPVVDYKSIINLVKFKCWGTEQGGSR